MDLSGQTVVVMGGSSGIGLATARLLSEQGAAVVITGRNPDKVQQAAAALPGQCRGAAVDATSVEQLARFFDALGPFEHLVLCVSGGEGAGGFGELEEAALRRAFDAKFWAQFAAARAALATLERPGSLTFVTAASARSALVGTAGLAAVNGALEAMVKPLANELRPLRVNAVSPGVVDTSWWERLDPAQREAMFAQTALELPVGRVGRPEDVAQAIAFLVGNGFVTGTVIECDGGARIR